MMKISFFPTDQRSLKKTHTTAKVIGCVETAAWNGATVAARHELHELPKVLLITMNDGIDPASGKRFAPSFVSF